MAILFIENILGKYIFVMVFFSANFLRYSHHQFICIGDARCNFKRFTRSINILVQISLRFASFHTILRTYINNNNTWNICDDSFFVVVRFESVLGFLEPCLLCMEYSILHQVELLGLKGRCLHYYAVHRVEERVRNKERKKQKNNVIACHITPQPINVHISIAFAK